VVVDDEYARLGLEALHTFGRHLRSDRRFGQSRAHRGKK
jgi:hypothetical protein